MKKADAGINSPTIFTLPVESNPGLYLISRTSGVLLRYLDQHPDPYTPTRSANLLLSWSAGSRLQFLTYWLENRHLRLRHLLGDFELEEPLSHDARTNHPEATPASQMILRLLCRYSCPRTNQKPSAVSFDRLKRTDDCGTTRSFQRLLLRPPLRAANQTLTNSTLCASSRSGLDLVQGARSGDQGRSRAVCVS